MRFSERALIESLAAAISRGANSAILAYLTGEP
jgi:hypothetical protein